MKRKKKAPNNSSRICQRSYIDEALFLIQERKPRCFMGFWILCYSALVQFIPFPLRFSFQLKGFFCCYWRYIVNVLYFSSLYNASLNTAVNSKGTYLDWEMQLGRKCKGWKSEIILLLLNLWKLKLQVPGNFDSYWAYTYLSVRSYDL